MRFPLPPLETFASKQLARHQHLSRLLLRGFLGIRAKRVFLLLLSHLITMVLHLLLSLDTRKLVSSRASRGGMLKQMGHGWRMRRTRDHLRHPSKLLEGIKARLGRQSRTGSANWREEGRRRSDHVRKTRHRRDHVGAWPRTRSESMHRGRRVTLICWLVLTLLHRRTSGSACMGRLGSWRRGKHNLFVIVVVRIGCPKLAVNRRRRGRHTTCQV